MIDVQSKGRLIVVLGMLFLGLMTLSMKSEAATETTLVCDGTLTLWEKGKAVPTEHDDYSVEVVISNYNVVWNSYIMNRDKTEVEDGTRLVLEDEYQSGERKIKKYLSINRYTGEAEYSYHAWEDGKHLGNRFNGTCEKARAIF